MSGRCRTSSAKAALPPAAARASSSGSDFSAIISDAQARKNWRQLLTDFSYNFWQVSHWKNEVAAIGKGIPLLCFVL